MPRLQRELVNQVVQKTRGNEIVAENVAAADLPAVVTALRPDVVVLGSPAAVEQSDQLDTLLCGGGSPVRVIALPETGSDAFLLELRRHGEVVDLRSPTAFDDAVAGQRPVGFPKAKPHG